MIIRIIESQLFAKFVYVCIAIDAYQFDSSYCRKVLHYLRAQGLTEHWVMRTARVNP